jgi:2-oxoglutarate ferredoxin oxidoreductase subunit beta
MGDGLDALKFYKQVSKIKHGCPTGEVGLTKQGEIIVGKFVDRVRPNYLDLMRAQLHESLGDRYVDNLHMSEADGVQEECECQQ